MKLIRTQWVAASLLFAATGLPAPVSSTVEERDNASWWIMHYGLVDSSTDALVARVQNVFDRLVAVADKRANRLPDLVVLDADGNPLAMSLPDGTVLLNRGALNVCYRRVSKPVGDARVAFLIGHELSHLGNDDFWHAAAFDAVKIHGTEDQELKLVRKRIQDAVEDVAKRELQADALGMLYMATAGYDPDVIFNEKDFFGEWAAELDRLDMRSAGKHPGPEERGAFLRTQLAAIASDLDFFHFGVRLLQLGRFEDGLILLERFRSRFPGREVFNNIGFGELALALTHQGACDERLLYRFKLPLRIDPKTLADNIDVLGRVPRVRSTGATSVQCTESESFLSHWTKAVRSLRMARNHDPHYVVARENLISALLVAGRGTAALTEANDALEHAPTSDTLKMLKAVALYLTGQENNVDTVDAAVATLNELYNQDPTSSEVAYNLARILTERDRTAAGIRIWRHFATLETDGPYRDQAREWVPHYAHTERKVTGMVPTSLPKSPIPLGAHVDEVRTQAMTVREIREGSFTGSILTSDHIKALAIDGIVEIVEVASNESESPSQVYGAPDRVHQGLRSELFFYDGLMVAWADGKPRKEVFFEIQRNPAR